MPNCGIVDMGSNTVRLSIYQYDGDGFRLLLGKKETVGLAGYVRDGVLTAEGIREAGHVLAGFRDLLDNLGGIPLHAFATASLRNVSNTAEAVEDIRSATGVRVAVLSGQEEGRLSYLGALWGLREGPGPGLLADIGGGSTELVVYENGAVRSAVSLPVGSLSLYTQHVNGLFPSEEELKAIRGHVRQDLEQVPAIPCSHLRGVGGTVRAAGKLCGLAPGQALPAGAVRELLRRLKRGGRDALRDILRLAPDRVHTILPGLVILSRVIKQWHVETVDVSAQGVREGYLLSHVLGKEAPHASPQ